jgi:hypothetical protein
MARAARRLALLTRHAHRRAIGTQAVRSLVYRLPRIINQLTRVRPHDYRLRYKDTLCGIKALLRSDYKKIADGRAFFGDFDPFGDFDLLFGAARLNMKITELPIRYRERAYGVTKISRFRHGWLLLRMSLIGLWKLKLS